MRNIRLILILVLLADFSAQGQSGYFGSRYSIDAQVNLGPSFKRSSSVKTIGGESIYARRLRIINPSFRFGFSFIASSRVEVGIAYEYARMRSYSENVRITPNEDVYDGSNGNIASLRLMDDVVFNKNGISLKTLIYIRGSKAPIGKYFGFSTNFGMVSAVKSSINYGIRGPLSNQSNYYSLKSGIDTLITERIRFVSSDGFYLNFRGALGRNYPLTKKIMLNIALSFPIINLLFDGNGGLPTLGAFYTINPLGSGDIFDSFGIFEEETTQIDGGDVNDLLLYTTHKYNRIQFDIGIKYNL